MKTCLFAFAMCQSMFCAIPFPCRVWDEKARGKMLLFLPVVGLEIGLIWAALAWAVRALKLPALAAGLALCACPFLLTGFIHLDGFMDVTDAVGSCRDLEKRRAILKDSHVGSFAVIGLCLLMLSQFALFSAAPERTDVRILALVPAVSRCCSALAVTGLRPMSSSQYAAQEKPRANLWILTGMLAVCLAAGFWLCGKYGFALLGCLAGYALALRRGYRSLDGMNGDIAGFSLTVGELCAAAVYALL